MKACHLTADDVLAIYMGLGVAAFTDGPAAGVALDVVRARRTVLLSGPFTSAASREVELLDEFEASLFEHFERQAKMVADEQVTACPASPRDEAA